ncbi:MAG: histidine phosphatase family protein [Lachnospiraceae bacterium]|nr:histidine phosphatase family protein [Lachnospiraceae bacterium]
MKIWLTRHGQTNLNKNRLMQGLTDEPLNDTGRSQAEKMRKLIGDVKFDAVYASPLDRAGETASIISGFDRKDIIIDKRIIEADFGKYEKKPYGSLGIKMTAYWAFPELFKTPDTVETVASMVERSRSFLKELEHKDYENVLVVCHGGIIRALRGYLEDRKNGIRWRPKPKNCQIGIYESTDGKHRLIKEIRG